MGRTLVGMVTFGNLKYTKLAVEAIKNFDVDLCVVVGKPNDGATATYLSEQGVPHLVHRENKGFPASLNDIYDFFLAGSWDNLIIQGNDVIPYPHSINMLIELSKDYDWVCGREVSVKSLVSGYPSVAKYFLGSDYTCTSLSAKPWEIFNSYSDVVEIDEAGLADCQNLNLYTRKAIEILGYTDANFYGNGYYNDNDYVRRAIKLNIKSCTSANSYYFHFWSRTIKEELKTNKYFDYNKLFYHIKWGGDFQHEKFEMPFNGKPYLLTTGIELPPVLKIADRSLEPHIINFWRNKR